MWKVLSFDKNLVQFYGSCEQDGKVLLVLEYMEVQLPYVIIHSFIHSMPLSGSLYELQHLPSVELRFQASPGISDFKCRDGMSETKRMFWD